MADMVSRHGSYMAVHLRGRFVRQYENARNPYPSGWSKDVRYRFAHISRYERVLGVK